MKKPNTVHVIGRIQCRAVFGKFKAIKKQRRIQDFSDDLILKFPVTIYNRFFYVSTSLYSNKNKIN